MTKKEIAILSVLTGVLGIGFLVLVILICANNLNPFLVDENVASWAYSIRGEKGGTTFWFFRIITEFGYTYFAIFAVILVGFIFKFKSNFWFFGGTLLASFLLQKLLKFLIQRPRPDESLWWMAEHSSSFPSGHAITVACIFVFICFFVCASPKVKVWVKWLICSLSTIIVFLVLMSRIILGVHYFTDVLGGLMFGSFVAVCGIFTYKMFESIKNSKRSKNIPQAD